MTEDFHSPHPDDLDGDDPDVESKAADTLSELSTSASTRLVTPECKSKGDTLLQNRGQQWEEWDQLQTPSPPQKIMLSPELMALAEKLKAQRAKAATVAHELPDHAA